MQAFTRWRVTRSWTRAARRNVRAGLNIYPPLAWFFSRIACVPVLLVGALIIHNLVPVALALAWLTLVTVRYTVYDRAYAGRWQREEARDVA